MKHDILEANTLLQRRLGRRTLFRGVGMAGLGLTGAALLGCNGDDEGSPLEAARDRGYITIGFANEAPYGFADESGNVTGEAPEVARVILAELGVPDIQGVVVTFDSLIPGLQARRFDIIAAGMFINSNRCAEVLFSDPDYCIPQAFGVDAGNPFGVMNYQDVANSDATIGVLSGGVEDGYAQAAGIPDDRITRFSEAPALAEGLQARRVDVIAATSLSIRAQLDRLADPNLEMTAGFTPIVDGEPEYGCGGYGFRRDDQELRDAFNDVLVSMKQNNEIVPITEPFGFGETEISAATDVTADDLCEA
ncbi:MAG: ectoine/hydroxyectoine ABC transporter substrate-binding protein EhuB [Dehalococcoidia bacterium]|nr:ectoine/hydroxyectoine ABC transporter substrate-binding protein EhuB [Dehalococcoidia bacterium]